MKPESTISYLHLLAQMGEAVFVHIEIKQGTPVNIRNVIQQTPLHEAVQSGSLPTVKVLLKARADVRAVDINGNTPLHLAATKNCPEIVSALLDAGADPNAYNQAGQCPLELTVGRSYCDGVGAAVVLLERGAATNQPMLDDLLKNIICRAASRRNSCRLVEILLERNAAVDLLSDLDFLCLAERDRKSQKSAGNTDLAKETQAVLRLINKRRSIPPFLVSMLL